MYRLLSHLWTNTISWQNGNRVCSQISSSLPQKSTSIRIMRCKVKSVVSCPLYLMLRPSPRKIAWFPMHVRGSGIFISTVDMLWLSYSSSNQYVLMGFGRMKFENGQQRVECFLKTD